MPQSCSWPSTLRFLNISRAKLLTITTCLPSSLEVPSRAHSRNQVVTYRFHFLLLFYFYCFTGLRFKPQQFKRVPFGPTFPERSQSLWKQASEAARWLAVPKLRILVNTGQNWSSCGFVLNTHVESQCDLFFFSYSLTRWACLALLTWTRTDGYRNSRQAGTNLSAPALLSPSSSMAWDMAVTLC